MSLPSSYAAGSVAAALGTVAGAAAPLVAPAPAAAQPNFPDVSSNYWAQPYIRAMAERDIVGGFPDGTFRPDEPVTRAQFAAMLEQTFSKAASRDPAQFQDVPQDHWARQAIRQAYATGFLSGYPNNRFRPGQSIPRVQALASLAGGLGYDTSGSVSSTLDYYTDAVAIPDWARNSIAAATQNQLVVNHPDVRQLQPNQAATRAEVAAFIYQALVSAGKAEPIDSRYVAQRQGKAKVVPAGTTLATRYEQAETIYLAPQEPKPVPVTLTVSQAVTNDRGQILIPSGASVKGELRTVKANGQQGARFVARQLVWANGRTVSLDASSNLITSKETVQRGASAGDILKGAAVGAGAAAAITAVTGDKAIATEEVLGGAAAGALGGVFVGREQVELIAIQPDRDLALTLKSPLTVQ